MRVKAAALGAVVGGALLALMVRRPPGGADHARRRCRQAGDALDRRLRCLQGRWRGVSYRLKRRRPDPDVADPVLGDRIRSSLGPLEKRLDLPHVHVMVQDHTALLHGEVATQEDLESIEEAAARVSGVVGVESFLHVGLIRGDTRPSEGRHGESHARTALVAAARGAGAPEDRALTAVRSVLGRLAERIPPDELDQVRAHLPADVQGLLEPPRRTGAAFTRVRHETEFVAAVLAADGVPSSAAAEVIRAVLGALKELVPEEVADVAAVLPHELRELWEAAPA